MGLVADIFNSEVLARLEGTAAIGHNRYSTTGSTSLKNCQPLVVEYARGGLALAHNGNLVNFQELRERLEASGSIFQSSSDSELVIHLIAELACAGLADASDRGAAAGEGRVLVGGVVRAHDDRGARSFWLSAARDRPAQ